MPFCWFCHEAAQIRNSTAAAASQQNVKTARKLPWCSQSKSIGSWDYELSQLRNCAGNVNTNSYLHLLCRYNTCCVDKINPSLKFQVSIPFSSRDWCIYHVLSTRYGERTGKVFLSRQLLVVWPSTVIYPMWFKSQAVWSGRRLLNMTCNSPVYENNSKIM